MKKQQRVLEETVWERTSELREVNEELEMSQEEIMVQNEEMQKQNVELENAIQTKNKLFSIIAHDLKNPFNTIIGFVNILTDDFDELNDVEKKEFIGILKSSSESAYELMGNLLDWARTQTNQITIVPQPIKVHEMVSRDVKLLKTMADKKYITINMDGVKQSHKILADVNMIDTVIRNILTNAIKFSPTGSSIRINSKSNNDNKFVDISIVDEGVGMNQVKVEQLFRINLNQSTEGNSGEKGTGLGLIICKEFIEKNKGMIEVKSAENVGTEFIISLPKVS